MANLFNLFVKEDREGDLKRVMLLATGKPNEYSQAIYATVSLWIETLERKLRLSAYDLNGDQMRYDIATINALKTILDYPNMAEDYINEMEKVSKR